MLTCVCRPVSGNLPKMPPNVIPIQKRTAANAIVVVTAEPKINVPGRLTSAELRAMALRQQQQIDSQHQLLATKEQRLRFLKSQEVRNAVANAEGERLRRLRERVEAQESKLRRLRALRGQVDLQKTYNVTLSNDLDSIRALFSEKEKELSLAVAKVEALTRQLEDLRRDRRCPLNIIAGTNGAAQQLPPQASRELEKLRRELMYRNQLTLQQDARLHMQREALQQRQAELRSVDQRIYELQTRLQRKRAANIQSTAQTQNHQMQIQQQQQQQIQQRQLQQQQQLAHQQQQQSSYPADISATTTTTTPTAYQSNLTKQGVAALKQQLLQKQQQQQQQQQQVSTTNVQQQASKFSNIIARGEQNRNIPRGNVAAVEPYIHTPQKSTITSTSSYLGGAGNLLKHAAATANTNQQNQLIQDFKLNLSSTTAVTATGMGTTTHSSNVAASHMSNQNQNQNFFSGAESDESKLAKKMLTSAISTAHTTKSVTNQQKSDQELESAQHIYAEVGPKKRDLQRLANSAAAATNAVSTNVITSNIDIPLIGSHAAPTTSTTAPTSNTLSSKIPKSIMVSTQAPSTGAKHNLKTNLLPSTLSPPTHTHKDAMPTEHEKKSDVAVISETLSEKNTQQLTVHSMPLGTANKSVATGVSTVVSNISSASNVTISESAVIKPKPLQQQLPLGSLAVPPRKPISSVAPTSVTSSIPKMITYSPKVNRVAPSVVTSMAAAGTTATLVAANLDRPALPPKPSKLSPTESSGSSEATVSSSLGTSTSAISLPAKKSPPSNADVPATLGIQTLNINDNLPIKAKPLTIRKQPLCEQPRLKSLTTSLKPPQQSSRKIDIPAASAFLFPETDRSGSSAPSATSAASNKEQSVEVGRNGPLETVEYSTNANSNSPNSIASSASIDETDKMDSSQSDKSPDSLKRRLRQSSNNNCNPGSKPKLTRRVSFDPLALLLDASLEGELELVKKTAMQVANPSAANDEGITALHNAICAGHFDIVKFLVEFGCDVNAQDSDGWTPLHCAASCNNLSMVKFLVENGACLFASTLSDHETPAEKCEEDEEGFDGCSEYLYSIQEKLGILHGGEVYAVFSYEAQNSDELTFNVNERLVILRKGDDAESEWWWAKNEHNEEGYVPRNLLGLYPRVSPQSSNFND